MTAWSDFYLVTGGAAAVLIGLAYVVVTLMQDRPRSAVLYGSRLYMGPIVLHMSFVLVLSAAALVPNLEARSYALITGVIALWGLARGIYSVAGIHGLRHDEEPPHWTDLWYYGVIPALVYVALAGVSVGIWNGAWWGADGVAAVIVALLLLSVRNEWDLVTWVAPRADSTPS